MSRIDEDYEEYRIYNEIMGDEEPDPDSRNGCLTVLFIVIAAVIIISLC